MKKSTKRELAAVVAEVFEQAHKATAVIDIINKFDNYVPEYQIGQMSIRQAWEELEKQRDTRKDIKGLVEASKAQSDRQLAELGEMKKTAVETRQGVGILVQHLPDADKPPHIKEAEAVTIMKRKGGDMTDRTLRNWLKTGKAGRVKTPISWDDLATVASWSAWADTYLAAENTRLSRKSFISSYAGMTQAEKSRRRSPTA